MKQTHKLSVKKKTETAIESVDQRRALSRPVMTAEPDRRKASLS